MLEGPVVLSKSVKRALETICEDAQKISLEDGGTLYGVQTLPSPTNRKRDFYVDCIDITAIERGYGSNLKKWGLFSPVAKKINPNFDVLGGYHTHPKDYGAVPKTNEDMKMLKSYQIGKKIEVIADMTSKPNLKAWKLDRFLNRLKEIEVTVDENKEGHGVIGIIDQYLNTNNKKSYPHPLKRILNSNPR